MSESKDPRVASAELASQRLHESARICHTGEVEWLPDDVVFDIGPSLPWGQAEAEGVMRTRLRVIGTPAPPNTYGLTSVAFHLVCLPSSPTGNEVPIAVTACILSVN